MTVEWTDDDQAHALAEGWDIWECFGSENGPWQLCRLDDPSQLPYLGYNEPKFNEDNEVWVHVWKQAQAGSHLHRKALMFVALNNPMEADAIDKWVDTHVVDH